MVASDWIVVLTRLIVILAACFAVVPLVRRSTRRRLTGEALVFGIILALIPTTLRVFGAVLEMHFSPTWVLLSRLDAPGFALILFGVVLGLRDASRSTEKLQKENLSLQREAATDHLTGLLNRREAELLLDYGAERARRSRNPLGFVMIDLDHFKKVNDTLGHQAGDAVLSHIGQLLKSRTRTGDIVARYGGEEFLMVMAEPNPQIIVAAAEDFRGLIEHNPAQYEGQQVPVTASFGVAVCPADTTGSIKECVRKADAALYAAKALGRNRVVSWDQVQQGLDDSARDLIRQAYGDKQLAA